MTRRTKKTIVSGNFTSAEDLKNTFLKVTGPRQTAKERGNSKFANDKDYWQGGRCNWGGSHKLDEDTEVLANFFNSIANINDDINKIRLSANESVFNSNKQQLISKLQGLISKCQITSSTSIGNICCIWNDFFGSFLKKFLDKFSSKLKRQLGEVEKLEPKHQQELLQLEDNLKKAESKYDENLAKYNDPNTSSEEKTKLMILVNEAADEIKKIKSKLKYNPLVNLERYNYLDDITKLAAGNASEPTSEPKNKNSKDPSRNKDNGNSSGNHNPFEDPKSFFEQNQTLIFIALALVAIFFLLYTQNQKEEDEDSKEEKKLMRQMMLMRMMNSSEKVPKSNSSE